MDPGRDPVEWGADDDMDLQDVVTWEPRSWLDRLAVRVHASIRPTLRATVVLLAGVLFVGLLSSGLLVVLTNPVLRILVVLSVVPAALLVTYVWMTDVTSEPATLAVATVLLGVLLAPIAAVVNDGVQSALFSIGIDVDASLLASGAYFFLIVAVGEETVKMAAVRLYAYRDARFDTVIDGAVYGALAGLGFALVENAVYITLRGGVGGVEGLAAITALRALAGPGHVVYSAIAGYYLGLAKFNPEYSGPIAVKGILIAAFLHGSYNTLVQVVPNWLVTEAALSTEVAIVGFVLGYLVVVGFFLYRRLQRYRRAYRQVYGPPAEEPHAELTEFDVGAGETVEDLPVGRARTGATPDEQRTQGSGGDSGTGDRSPDPGDD